MARPIRRWRGNGLAISGGTFFAAFLLDIENIFTFSERE